MSFHEGSNWQARKEDEGKPLYENEPKKQIESPLDALRSIDLMFDQIGEGYSIEQIREYVTKSLRNHQPPSTQQPVDAVATANNPHWLYTQWCEIWEQAHNNNRSDFQKLMRKNYALFSGSQASNQSDEQDLWADVNDLQNTNDNYDDWLKAVKSKYNITAKHHTQRSTPSVETSAQAWDEVFIKARVRIAQRTKDYLMQHYTLTPKTQQHD